MNSIDRSARSVWHVAFIVADLEATKTELATAIGATWGDLHPVDAELGSDVGLPQRVRTKAVFSENLPCAIELIEAAPGTVLDFQGESAFHHMGYWSDVFADDTDHLRHSGWPCVGTNGDRISLHRGPSGITVEVCNLAIDRPSLRQFYPVPRP
jgi:hypothetical protein